MTHHDHQSACTIGLVTDFFNSRVLDGAYAYTQENDLSLDARWSVRGDWTPKDPNWQGLIYSVVDMPPLLRRMHSWKLPKVSLIHGKSDPISISPDYHSCGKLAANALIESGASLLINAQGGSRGVDTKFAEGVHLAAKQAAVRCKKIVLEDIGQFDEMIKLITENKKAGLTSGLCIPHAGSAYGIQQHLIEHGLCIPEDSTMCVLEVGAQRTPSLAPVPLTSIQLNDWHRGFVAAEMVHRQILGLPLTEQHPVIPPRGVIRRASTGHPERFDRVVAKSLSFIRKNFLQPINVTDVVQATGVSRRIVETRFRQTLNRGIHEELNRLRIDEAKRQLAAKANSITIVSEMCGFSSVHYFSAAFKKETGLSPRAFQKSLE
ncbi:hypothetical protein NT6N_29280 [Oceaniferula spumae]|uniref:HTH araC/xylS-type domain-containing protein n=1 Tax=Oceaniferula spumae TaxID=2979115 RepID=A0AAT9FPM2_9BACT